MKFDRAKFDAYRQALADGKEKLAQKYIDQLVCENMPFVTKTVRAKNKGLCDFEDLQQAGAIGLIKAIQRYDPTKASFTTYAALWIRHEVQTCLDKTNHTNRKGEGTPYKFSIIKDKFYAQFGREPTAEELGVPDAKVKKWQWRVWMQSLSDPAAEETGERNLTVLDVLDSGALNAEELLARAAFLDKVKEALHRLPTRQRVAFEGSYIDGRTNHEISRELKCGRNTVRRLKAEAAARMQELVRHLVPGGDDYVADLESDPLVVYDRTGSGRWIAEIECLAVAATEATQDEAKAKVLSLARGVLTP